MSIAEQTHLETPRVRFNFGFHDGTLDAHSGRQRDVSQHFDPVYAHGYLAGHTSFDATGKRADSSEPAWQHYMGNPLLRCTDRHCGRSDTDENKCTAMLCGVRCYPARFDATRQVLK